jgi:choline-sulfatase
VLRADTFAIASSGVVTVQEYGSSSAPGARSVSTRITPLLPLLLVLAACGKETGHAAPASSAVAAVPPAPSAGVVHVVPPAPAKLAVPANLDVILISIDCLRADMPWAGYPRAIAPRLTALEAKSIDFTDAYSMSSYTSMSLGGLLGGKLPGEMNRDGYFFGFYGKSNVLFPELLQASGIRTLAGHSHGYFNGGSGLDQGFDRWEVVPGLKWDNTTDENITSPRLEALAEKLLSEPDLTKKRFFAWFHFLDPHDRYLPHEGIGPYGHTGRDLYDAEVTFTDGYVGKLLDFVAAQPWGAHTAFIITGDHGEAFGEHHQYRHGFELWQNLVRVPLFVYLPGAPPRHIDNPTSAIDLAPTILDLFGVPNNGWPPGVDGGGAPGFEGRSLVPDLLGLAPVPRDVVIDLPATSDSGRRRALVHGTTKIIAFGDHPYFQVFDLAADPGELHPITKGDVYQAMITRFHAFEEGVHDVMPTKCKESCLDGAYARKKKDGG